MRQRRFLAVVLAVSAAMLLGACGTSKAHPNAATPSKAPSSKAHSTRPPSTAHVVTPSGVTRSGGLEMSKPKSSEAASLGAKNLELTEMPAGWTTVKASTSGVGTLPNCSGFPTGSLSGPVEGPVLEQATSAAGPSLEAASGLWTATSPAVASSVVHYLISSGGVACLDHGSPSKVVHLKIGVPKASAVAAYTSASTVAGAPHLAIVFFSEGKLLAEVVFADRSAPFPLAVAAHALSSMAARMAS